MGVLSRKPTAAAPENSKATAWRRASTALAALALVAVIGPVAANVLLSTKDEHAQRQDQKKEAAANEADEEEEEEEEEQSTGGGVMGFFGGGGSGGGGSRSGSSSDVMACNRAANTARRNTSPPVHQGLAKALDKAGGGLLGATANSLYGVEQQAADDVRAADAFKACMDASR